MPSSSGFSQQFVVQARARHVAQARAREWRRFRRVCGMVFALMGASLVPAMVLVSVMAMCCDERDPLVEAHEVLKAAQVYRLVTGVFPAGASALAEGERPVMARVPVDGWGRVYLVGLRWGADGRVGPVVRSAGADGVWFSDDDVVAW